MQRTLEFRAEKQKLSKNPGCDFSEIVSGSSGYLRAKFYFSEEWDGTMKAASFYGVDDSDEHAFLLDENDECDIPDEVLHGKYFIVSMLGVKEPKYVLQTNKMKVKQKVKQEVL